MSTITPTRTLRDVLIEHLDATTYERMEAYDGMLAGATGMVGIWRTKDLRPSEDVWIDDLADRAYYAGKQAYFDAATAVLADGLRQLGDQENAAVPAHLLEQGSDELRADVVLALEGKS